jgi:thiosulfate/3-mercaptopyruvate sulfurtransferase
MTPHGDQANGTQGVPGPLVDAAWLDVALRGRRPGLVVADVRWYPDRPARAGFHAGHIPDAVFVDLDGDLAAPARPNRRGGRHPLPSPEAFAEAMSRLGIGDGDALVAYDDVGGSYAARLWWMLTVTGHAAALLDGGLQAWTGSLEAGPGRPRTPASFTARAWPSDAIATAADVDRLRTDRGGVLLDARAAERYRGETEPIDAVAGHIPGARNAPWAGNLDPRTGRFLSAQALRRRFRAAGVDGSTEVVAYCGSGVTACHDLLALQLAGFRASLYTGSWSDWISDQSRPVAVGDDERPGAGRNDGPATAPGSDGR